MISKRDRVEVKNMRQVQFLLTSSFTIREILETFFLLDLKRGGEKTN